MGTQLITSGYYRDTLKQLVRDFAKEPTQLKIYLAGFMRDLLHWNHAKIIAVDGKRLLTGGHNLWDVAYLRHAPVTDTSLELTGEVVRGANIFLDHQWKIACLAFGGGADDAAAAAPKAEAQQSMFGALSSRMSAAAGRLKTAIKTAVEPKYQEFVFWPRAGAAAPSAAAGAGAAVGPQVDDKTHVCGEMDKAVRAREEQLGPALARLRKQTEKKQAQYVPMMVMGRNARRSQTGTKTPTDEWGGSASDSGIAALLRSAKKSIKMTLQDLGSAAKAVMPDWALSKMATSSVLPYIINFVVWDKFCGGF